MTLAAEELVLWVGAVMWPFARIGAMLVAMPIFGANTVNARVRMGLAFLLAVFVALQGPELPDVDPFSLHGLLVTLHQVVIGVFMGFILQLVFSAVTQAGEVIALGMGLGFASIVDPAQGVQVPVVATIFVIFSTLLFLAMNGHLVALDLLLTSFETMPIAPTGLNAEAFYALAGFGSTMFVGAVLVALPAVAALLLVNIAMGVITRASPQLNIFAVGFPLMIVIGFVFLMFTLPGLPERFGELLFQAFQLVQARMGF